MKRLSILAAALLCLTPLAASSSSKFFRHHSSQARQAVGTYGLVAKGSEHIVFLANNKCFEPVNDIDAQKIDTWIIGESVRILKKKKGHRYILANLTTGETATVRVYPTLKKVIGTFPLIAKGSYNKILLGNNIFYRPAGDINEEKADDWHINDSIEVIKAKRHHYLLVNHNNGRFLMTKIADVNSSSASSI